MNSFFNNPIFQAGGIPDDGVGGGLTENPFGGVGLNVGGFTGDASYGSSAGGINPSLGFLTAANSALAGYQQSQLNQSAQNQFAAQNAMFGANFGKDLFAQNRDRWRSLHDPIDAAQIAVSSGPYRQRALRDNLLAGKYSGSSFGAYTA